MSWLLMSSWVGWVCLIGFAGLIFLFIVRFVSGLSLLLVLVNLGVGTVVFHKVVRFSMVFIVALYVLWCHLESMLARQTAALR